MKKLNPEKKFWIGLALPLLLLGTLIVPNMLVLFNVGELSNEKHVAKSIEKDQQCVFGNATNLMDIKQIKLELFRLKKPQIVVIGSSRALQFTDDFFSKTFLNMGGTVRNVFALDSVIQGLQRSHTPSHMLIIVDYWWFHDRQKPISSTKILNTRQRFRAVLDSLFLPTIWLASKKIQMSEFLALMFEKRSCHFGMKGHIENAGFQNDGSHFGGRKIYLDQNRRPFEQDLAAIYASSGTYIQSDFFSQENWTYFSEVITGLENNGVDVTLVLPPMAPSIYSAMQRTNGYDYIAQLQQQLQKSPFNVFDFHNPASLNTNDCEFLDGNHQGEIVNGLILSKIIEKNNRLPVNLDALMRVIQTQRGLTIRPNRLKQQGIKDSEADFLGIGCDKAQIVKAN